MADIFISYARTDRDRIEKLAAALEAEGYAVWWDRHIAGGAEYSKDIEAALNASKAVIVAWSQSAIESTWVKDEAVTAREQGKLIPVTLDGAAAPMGFKQFHLIDLDGWKGEIDDPGFDDLNRTIKARLTGEAPAPSPSPRAPKKNSALAGIHPSVLIVGIVAAAIIAIVAMQGPDRAPPAADPPPTNESTAIETPQPAAVAQTPDAAPEASIAVLPFADMSAEGDQEYFADGIAEEILNLLAKSPEMKVAGRTSSFQFKGRNEDLRGIGEQLGVAHILEGSLRKSGDKVRITAQLIRSADGFHLWSETYDGTLDDIFELQETIATQIAEELRAPLGLTAGELAESRSENPEAYRLFLEASSLYAKRGPGVVEAAEKLRRATQLDPEFAEAWALLSSTLSVWGGWVPGLNDDPLRVAAVNNETTYAALRAYDIDPDSPLAMHAVGLMYLNERQWGRSYEMLQDVMAAAPNSTVVLEDYFEILEFTGQWDEALPVAQKLTEVDPLSAYNWVLLGYGYWDLKQYDEAKSAFERALELDPDFTTAYTEYTALLIETEDYGTASAVVDLLKARPSSAEQNGQRRAQCLSEMVEQARAPSEDFQPCYSYESFNTILAGSGVFQYVIGGRDTVLDVLEEMAAIDDNIGLMNINAKYIDDTRADPRYKELVKIVGFDRFWRKYGWPSYCRPVGDDDFECAPLGDQ